MYHNIDVRYIVQQKSWKRLSYQ
jgi:hypothetical protein